MEALFSRLAQWIGAQLGKPHTFATACAIVIIWGLSGQYFGYSDTWQLVINTSTTIITFLMVFLLRHTQNRDTRVIQLKLDELIRSNENARSALFGLDDVSDEDMRRPHDRFASLAKAGDIPAGLRSALVDLATAKKDMERAEHHIERAVAEAKATPPR